MIRRPYRERRRQKRAAVNQAMMDIMPFDMAKIFGGHWNEAQAAAYGKILADLRQYGMPTAAALIYVLFDTMYYLADKYQGSMRCQNLARDAVDLAADCIALRTQELDKARKPHN